MKIYVVTEGSYSDYHICAVFTDKELAEEYLKWHCDKNDGANIEEYESDSERINDRYLVCYFEYGLNNNFNIIVNRYKIDETDHASNDVPYYARIISEKQCASEKQYGFYGNSCVFVNDDETKITVPYLLRIKRYFNIEKIPTKNLAILQMNKIAQDKIAEIKNYILIEGMDLFNVNQLISKSTKE